MSAFLLFLLFLFIFFIVIPLFRVGRTVRNVRRQYREAFDSARNDSRREAERHPGGWSAPRRRKAKVVARDEGEYVEWEEVTSRTSDASASSASDTTVRVEERITDAEWEDIK